MISRDGEKISLKDLKRFYSMANFDSLRDMLNEK